MARVIKSDCVGCPSGVASCGSCSYGDDYEVLVCDECESEEDELYLCEGEELCEKCLLGRFEKVEL